VTRRATYRVQLRREFGFAEASAQADYLAALKRDEFFEWHATVGDWEHDHYLTAF